MSFHNTVPGRGADPAIGHQSLTGRRGVDAVPHPIGRIAVRQPRFQIGDKPVVTGFNKMDQVEQPETLKDLHSDYQVQISAKTGAGLDELKDILEMILRNRKIYLEKVFSYQEAGRIQTIRKYGQLLKEEYREDGIYVEAYVPTELYAGLMR